MHRKLEYLVFFLGFSGLLFAGYLSTFSLLNETCAFNERCPYFLGYPACYYGFFMYLAITLFAGLHVLHRYDGEKANQIVLWVSSLGIIFSGYFTILELPLLFEKGLSAYILGLPSCALGLLFYIFIASISFRLRRDFIR